METAVLEQKQRLSVEAFLMLQSQTEKALEYNNGEVFEINHTKSTELLTVKKLTRKFIQTKAFQDGGELFQEIDCWLTEEQMRRSDFAFFSKAQILESSEGKHPIPEFIIEILSGYDNANYTENKVLEYQRAGVKVIWHIYPELKIVKVIRGKEARYYEGNEVFDASPILSEFQIGVEELFSRV